jgi:hypothetical protein
MLATGRGDGAILIVLTATTAVVSRASRAPAVAQVLFVALLTVASYVMAFGGVGSAALDSAVAHSSFRPLPLRCSSALRFVAASSPGLGPAGTAPTSRSFSSPPG